MKTLTIIPARSGSKGLPGKNLMNFCGQPLISWSIKQAKNAGMDKNDNRIVVSTDSKEYKEKIDSWFPNEDLVPYIRPKNLARDDTPSNKFILDAIERFPGFDTVLLLEPTSPLRTTSDITQPLAIIREGKAKAVVSVSASHRMHPLLSFRMNRNLLQPNTDMPHLRRQAMTPFYHLTGTIYATDIKYYQEHKTFITDKTYGYIVKEYQDYEIDTQEDLISMTAICNYMKSKGEM